MFTGLKRAIAGIEVTYSNGEFFKYHSPQVDLSKFCVSQEIDLSEFEVGKIEMQSLDSGLPRGFKMTSRDDPNSFKFINANVYRADGRSYSSKTYANLA